MNRAALPIHSVLPCPRRVNLSDTEQHYARLAVEHSQAGLYYLTLHLTGPRIRKSEMERSLRALQLLYPILRCAIVKVPPNGFELVESNHVRIPVHWRDGKTSDFRSLYEEEFNAKPFPLEKLDFPNAVFCFQPHTTNAIHLVFAFQRLFLGHDAPATRLAQFAHEFLDHLFEGFKHFPSPPVGRHVNAEPLRSSKQYLPSLSLVRKNYSARTVLAGFSLPRERLKAICLDHNEKAFLFTCILDSFATPSPRSSVWDRVRLHSNNNNNEVVSIQFLSETEFPKWTWAQSRYKLTNMHVFHNRHHHTTPQVVVNMVGQDHNVVHVDFMASTAQFSQQDLDSLATGCYSRIVNEMGHKSKL